jgi:hypothetical protein
MDKRKIVLIIIMVLCLGIFFFNLIKNKSNIESAKEIPTATYEPGAFKDKGEMWDYLHAHKFRLAGDADPDSAPIMTTQNYELYLNGQKFSEGLEVTDFQYAGVGLSGFNMQGKRLRMVLQKDSVRCVLVDMTDENQSHVYKAIE